MTTPGSMFFNMLAAFAAFDVDLLRPRLRREVAIARPDGKLKGRQPSLSARQHANLLKLHSSGERSISELAQLLCVSRATIYPALDGARTRVG